MSREAASSRTRAASCSKWSPITVERLLDARPARYSLLHGELVDVHDFQDQAIGKAIPYGVYEVAENTGFVNVGTDHDTSVGAWWNLIHRKRSPNAGELFITADAGGSNGYRSRVWKAELQRLADDQGITIRVSHLPPGTSETVVNLIGNTTNLGGLVVCRYPPGKKIVDKEMRTLNLKKDASIAIGTT